MTNQNTPSKTQPPTDKWDKYPEIEGNLMSFTANLFGTARSVHIALVGWYPSFKFERKESPRCEPVTLSADLTVVDTQEKECDSYIMSLSSHGIELAADSMTNDISWSYTLGPFGILVAVSAGAAVYAALTPR